MQGGRAQNKKGVTLPSCVLHDQLEEWRIALPEDVRPRRYGAAGSGTARKAMSRLRKRWGGRIGRLRPRDVLPVGVMRAKASCALCTSVHARYGRRASAARAPPRSRAWYIEAQCLWLP